MANLGIIAAAVFLALLLFVVWRSRVRAVQGEMRLEAEATRGRELEAIAMDAASMLAAAMQSIATARDAVTSETSAARSAMEDAEKAATALSSLFTAARLYMQDHSAVVRDSADGCIRVAVAVARSRGWGISVRGEEATLRFQGRQRTACELVIDVLGACKATLGPDEFVEVHLGDELRVLGGSVGEIAAPIARAAELSWTIEPFSVDQRRGVRVFETPQEAAPNEARNGMASVVR